MTEPSQYFKGRTVQEQMNEVIGYVDTRAAEVATDAIAADVTQVHQDMLDADADAQAAAASAAAAAGTLANAVKKTGEASQSIAGDIAISGTTSLVDVAVSNTIEVPTPSNDADAATKKYVDDADALKLNIADVNSCAVGLTGNQSNINGIKTFVKPLNFMPGDWHSTYLSVPSVGNIALFAQLKNQSKGRYIEIEVMQSSNGAICRGEIGIINSTSPSGGWFLRKGFGSNNPVSAANAIVIVKDASGNIFLGCRRLLQYGGMQARVIKTYSYGNITDTPSPYIEWLSEGVDIGDGTGYTLTELSE